MVVGYFAVGSWNNTCKWICSLQENSLINMEDSKDKATEQLSVLGEIALAWIFGKTVSIESNEIHNARKWTTANSSLLPIQQLINKFHEKGTVLSMKHHLIIKGVLYKDGWRINMCTVPTGVVVWPEVAYLRVVGSFPTQWTRLSTELVCVGSRLHKPTVCLHRAWWTL